MEAPSASVEDHLEAATKNAFGDEQLLETYRKYSCFEVEDPSVRDEYRAGSDVRIPLTEVLDGLWCIGDGYVGQYILETESGGLALIDTLNDSNDVETYTLPALEALGLSEDKPLEGVFISHGHWDHDGGAPALRAHFGPNLPIYLGSGDAEGKTYEPTLIDTSTSEVQEITLGETRMHVQPTPGHTPGNLVGFLPVEHDGEHELLLVNGRSGIPQSIEESLQYLEGAELQYEAARSLGATGIIHTHPLSDGSLRQITAVNETGADDPDFILGTERTLQAAAIWRECAAARVTELHPSVDVPVWRATTIQRPEQRPLTRKLSATVGSPWGPVVGEVVTFRDGESVACEAVTDADGVAECRSEAPIRPHHEVTATFEGSGGQDYVNLPSTDARAAVQR
ncbi:MBL fold metallo-hydrolase [Nesterenkonia sp. CL21]|uniref:MBL fold metallo-hydrolase n=1 Tax=Nesterenkonia sp. CL21 TaxID=3064894 RepID=UPI00287A5690|nr:MBL fold metallo-hydrolase [Nesterenkonia sp. CL21]MDS2172754.1 MBL fold metallo-hydrolase [Nesterenkonia sp. CL21]